MLVYPVCLFYCNVTLAVEDDLESEDSTVCQDSPVQIWPANSVESKLVFMSVKLKIISRADDEPS